MTVILATDRQAFGFHRTECDCADCSAYCRVMPGALALGDLEPLYQAGQMGRAAMQTIFEWAREHLRASPGALALRGGATIRIPTLVPALIEQVGEKRCVYLTASGGCRVHAVSPWSCAGFDSHMTREEGDRRSTPMLIELLRAWDSDPFPLYCDVWVDLFSRKLTSRKAEDIRAEVSKVQQTLPESENHLGKETPT